MVRVLSRWVHIKGNRTPAPVSPALAEFRAFAAEHYASDEQQPPAGDEAAIKWLIKQLPEHNG